MRKQYFILQLFFLIICCFFSDSGFCVCDGECLRKKTENESTSLFLRSIKLQSLNEDALSASDLSDCRKAANELIAAHESAALKKEELEKAGEAEIELKKVQSEIDRIRKDYPGITSVDVRKFDTGRKALLEELQKERAALKQVRSEVDRTLPAELNSSISQFSKGEQAKAREYGSKFTSEIKTYFSSCNNYLDGLIECVRSNTSLRGCRTVPFNCKEPDFYQGLPAGAAEMAKGYLSKAGIKNYRYGGICSPFREYYSGLLAKAGEGKAEVIPSQLQGKEKVKAEESARLVELLKDRDRFYGAYSGHMENAHAAGDSEDAARDRYAKLIEKAGVCDENGECRADIKDFKPNSPNIAIKPTIPVTMPGLTAASAAEDSLWHFKTKFIGQLRLCECDASAEGKWFYLSKASVGKPHFICGGDYSLELSVNCGGKSKERKQAVEAGVISGRNPAASDVRAEVDRLAKTRGCEGDIDMLKRIACHESGRKLWQFGPDNMPLVGYPHDFGIFQISSPKDKALHCRTAWDWVFNIDQGIGIFLEKKSEVISHEFVEKGVVSKPLPDGTKNRFPRNEPLWKCIEKVLSDKLVGLPSRKREQLIAEFQITPLSAEQRQLEALKRYNGGREYQYYPLEENGGFSPKDGCKGKWEPVTRGVDDIPMHSAYVKNVLNMDPKTCVEIEKKKK